MIGAPFRAGSIRLADGRALAYAVGGAEDGFPILYLHGAIGSPLRASPGLAQAIDRLGVRWVCVERPGFGRSDRRPGRTLLDFAGDIRQLAATLRMTRIGLVGVSAGGPYALACAHGLPDLIGAAAVCSSISPVCPPYAVPGLPARMRLPMRAIAARPRASTAVLDAALRAARRHPALVRRAMTFGAPRPDKVLLDDPEARSTAVHGVLAASARGAGGLVEDYLVCCRPWGFQPEQVEVEIHLWHGGQDILVPIDHARHLAAILPNCRAVVDPADGHFFFRRRAGEILARLTRAARLPTGAPAR